MELCPAKPCVVTDLEDLIDRLAGEYPHDRRLSGSRHNVPSNACCYGSGSFSKNNAEIGGPGTDGRRRLLGSHQPANLDLSGHVSEP